MCLRSWGSTTKTPMHICLTATVTNIERTTVKRAKDEAAERERIIQEHALAELKKKQAAEAAAAARKKADAEAVERWKTEQAEKASKEKREQEEYEADMRHEMRDRLLASGVPEHEIEAILDGRRVNPRPMPPPMPGHRPMGFGQPPPPPMIPGHRPIGFGQPPPPPPLVPGSGHHQPMDMVKTTYTRMARKHLSTEALRAKAIEFEFDSVRIGLFAFGQDLFTRLHTPFDKC